MPNSHSTEHTQRHLGGDALHPQSHVDFCMSFLYIATCVFVVQASFVSRLPKFSTSSMHKQITPKQRKAKRHSNRHRHRHRHRHPHPLPHHHRRRLRPHRYIIISLPKASSSASYAGGYQVTSCPCHCRRQCHYLYLYHLGSRAT